MLNSSQEDLFADPFKSSCLDASVDPAAVDEYHHQNHHDICHASNDYVVDGQKTIEELFHNTKITLQTTLCSTTFADCVTYSFCILHKNRQTASISVQNPQKIAFPPPFCSILLSTQRIIPTTNEFPVSRDFLTTITNSEEVSDVIIFGAVNGLIYALLVTSNDASTVGIIRILPLPNAEPITGLSVLYDIPSRMKSNRLEDVEAVLVAVSQCGLLLTLYGQRARYVFLVQVVANSEASFYKMTRFISSYICSICYLSLLRRKVAVFRLPECPLSPCSSSSLACIPQGSWLHILSPSTGKLLSVSFSFSEERLCCLPRPFPDPQRTPLAPAPPLHHPVTSESPSPNRSNTTIDLDIGVSSGDICKSHQWRDLNIIELLRLPSK